MPARAQAGLRAGAPGGACSRQPMEDSLSSMMFLSLPL